MLRRMPYAWLTPPEAPEQRLHLWPYRSLTNRGFVLFMLGTVALIVFPALLFTGHAALWFLAVPALAVVAGIWWALRRSTRDGEVLEELVLAHDRARLVRAGPRGARAEWTANTHWVRITVHPTAGPVPHYVTLTGAGREVEIGAFLSEDERIAVSEELQQRLRGMRPA
jgi:uncharacterized membrane protein